MVLPPPVMESLVTHLPSSKSHLIYKRKISSALNYSFWTHSSLAISSSLQLLKMLLQQILTGKVHKPSREQPKYLGKAKCYSRLLDVPKALKNLVQYKFWNKLVNIYTTLWGRLQQKVQCAGGGINYCFANDIIIMN